MPGKSATENKNAKKKNKPAPKPALPLTYASFSSQSAPKIHHRGVFIPSSAKHNVQSDVLAQTQQKRRSNRQGSVLYRSGALKEVAPELVAPADSPEVQNCRAVLLAHAMAERVKTHFKKQILLPVSDKGVNKPRPSQAEQARRYDRRLPLNRNSAAATRIRREAYTKALEKLLYEHSVEENKVDDVGEFNWDFGMSLSNPAANGTNGANGQDIM